MSRDYKGRKIVVYPQYIDSNKTRREGRRLSLKDSVPSPRIEEIVRAAEELNLEPIVESESRYPRNWWSVRGRVVVDKVNSKLYTLKIIAGKIKELRGLK